MKKQILSNKKGSHVGFVLSFVIFAGFLIFLYSIIQPSMKLQEDKQNVLDNLKIVLEERFSLELTTFTVVVNDSISQDCIELEDFMDDLPGPSILVKNESGGFVSDIKISPSPNENNLQIKRANDNNYFFKIYHSTEFPEIIQLNIASCGKVKNDSYSIKSVKSNEEIFLEIINKTKIEYDNNYENLKGELNIPLERNFGFTFTDKDLILIETPQINTSTSVYAEEMSILYVDQEGNINPGFLIIRVW